MEKTEKIIKGDHRCSGGVPVVGITKPHPNSQRANGGTPVVGITKPHPNSHRCGG